MVRKWIVGFPCGRVLHVALVIGGLMLPGAVFAQHVDEGYIVNHLGPAAEAMERAGVNGSLESSPVIIEIGQQWGLDPAYWVGVDEARMIVRSADEDRELRGRQASLTGPLDEYPSRALLVRFGVLRVGLTCAQAQAKAQAAQRLAESLGRIAQLNGAGAGLIGAISQGAARFVAPMAFATMVTGFAATWAGQLAAGYRNAPCVAGGQQWRFRPNVLKTSLFPDHFRTPLSSPGRRGCVYAALRTGLMSRPTGMVFPSLTRSASGPSYLSLSRWS